MATHLKGVKRRKPDDTLYFEMRCGDTKLFSLQIKTKEEGALAYDIVRLHMEKRTEGVVGAKRKFARELNYPEYSRSIPLDPELSRLDIEQDKGTAMRIILHLARAAAVNLPENLRRSTTAVGDPSPSNRSSSHQNDHRTLPDVSEGTQDLPTMKVLETSSVIGMHNFECSRSLFSKLKERQGLERMVAGIEEGSGFISIPGPVPEMFHRRMACLKLLLKDIEQTYVSEESECSNLRKKLEDHNYKALEARMMSPKNRFAGRQRSSENERFPHVSEPRSPEEQDGFGVPVGGSETCGPLASSRAIVTPCGTHTTMAQPVVLLESESPAVDPPDLIEYINSVIPTYFPSTNAGSSDWSLNICEMG